MAAKYATFIVTTPLGTAIANPLVTALRTPNGPVERIDVTVPTGCNGALGFAFGAAGIVSIPNLGGFIVASGETVPLPVDAQIESGAWQCFTYNLSTAYSHTIYVRFAMKYTPPATVITVPDTATIAALTSATTGA